MYRIFILKGQPPKKLLSIQRKLFHFSRINQIDNAECRNMDILFEKEIIVGSNMAFRYGRFGHLSDASVLLQVGNTVVHAAVNSERPDGGTVQESFLPLTVDYRFRQYGTMMLVYLVCSIVMH